MVLTHNGVSDLEINEECSLNYPESHPNACGGGRQKSLIEFDYL